MLFLEQFSLLLLAHCDFYFLILKLLNFFPDYLFAFLRFIDLHLQFVPHFSELVFEVLLFFD